MSPRWKHQQAGVLELELPSDWTVEEQPTGTLLVKAPGDEICLTMNTICLAARAGELHAPVPQGISGRHAETELERSLQGYKQVRFFGAAHVVPGTSHVTSTIEGAEAIREGVSWWQRLLHRGPVVAWRFWAVMNAHLLVLAHASADPLVMDRQRAVLDRLIASVQLPNRDLLVGRPFTEVVASLARGYFPRTQVAMIDDVHLRFGTCQVDLVPLHRRYLEAPDQLSQQVRNYFSEVQRLNDSAAGISAWEEVRGHVLPCLAEPAKLGRFGGGCAHQEWVNGLHVAYVVDEENGACRAVTTEDLDLWMVDLDELHERSLENLIERSSELTMEVSRADGYVMLALTTPDPYNASRILLPSLHRTLREHLGQTFYVAIPSREFLLAFSTSSDEVLARVRKQIVTDYRRASSPVSTKIFLATPDGIAGDPEEPDEFTSF